MNLVKLIFFVLTWFYWQSANAMDLGDAANMAVKVASGYQRVKDFKRGHTHKVVKKMQNSTSLSKRQLGLVGAVVYGLARGKASLGDLSNFKIKRGSLEVKPVVEYRPGQETNTGFKMHYSF